MHRSRLYGEQFDTGSEIVIGRAKSVVDPHHDLSAFAMPAKEDIGGRKLFLFSGVPKGIDHASNQISLRVAPIRVGDMKAGTLVVVQNDSGLVHGENREPSR